MLLKQQCCSTRKLGINNTEGTRKERQDSRLLHSNQKGCLYLEGMQFNSVYHHGGLNCWQACIIVELINQDRNLCYDKH